MVHVLVGREVDEQGRVALEPEGERRNHGTLDAVRTIRAEGRLDRPRGIAVGLEVLRELRQEVLNLPWSRQACELLGLPEREAAALG